MGFEALLNLVPLQTKNFRWEFTANTSYNKTKVLDYYRQHPANVSRSAHIAFNGEVRACCRRGNGTNSRFWLCNEIKGQRIFQVNGLPLRTPDLFYLEVLYLNGQVAFLNSFNYKGISLTVFIDYKLGNKMLSGTNFNAVRHGLHKMTLEGRVRQVC